ncbi:MAG: hypothetical protein JXR76_21310 [Deltaproteobacteria bacterium]|nr:hypothetical protein [Deltaproteobacteria bacterium]
MKTGSILFVSVFGMIWVQAAQAATFTVNSGDDWTTIENAQAGDIVEIAPGTYDFRVHLDNAGTANNPIIIRAQDPSQRPVWDLVGDEDHLVSDAPGSYSAGDLGRGCWQVGADGAYYEISGIVFRNCRDSASAGLRAVNSGPVTLRDCLFENNTNGLTGASTDLVVEHCEFRNNGKVFEGGNMTHNIYIYGGQFTMRYCYNHDSHEGQLFHVRAANTRIEYNWLARPSGYVGDIMSCEYLCDGTEQYMTLMGNVIIQGTPQNQSQIIALYDDEETGVTEMNISLFYNTIIGTQRNPGQTHTLLNLRNDSIDTHATLYNNIIYNVGQVATVADSGLSNWSVTGAVNWLGNGTENMGLSEVISGDAPGFVDEAALNFTLVEAAAARNEANASLCEAPLREYYLNESTINAYRERSSAADLGAFEFGTNGAGIDAYGATPLPTLPEDTDSVAVDTATGTVEDTESASTDSGTIDMDTMEGSTDSADDSDSLAAVDDTESNEDNDTGTAAGEGCGCRSIGQWSAGSIFRLLEALGF